MALPEMRTSQDADAEVTLLSGASNMISTPHDRIGGDVAKALAASVEQAGQSPTR
jgi:hypothetical protein